MLSVRFISHVVVLTCHNVTVTLSPGLHGDGGDVGLGGGEYFPPGLRSKSLGLEGSLYSSTPAWIREVSLLLAPSTPTHSATWSFGGVPAVTLGTVKVPFTTVNGPPVVEYPDQLELWVAAGRSTTRPRKVGSSLVGTTFLGTTDLGPAGAAGTAAAAREI